MEKLVYVDRRNTNCNKWDGQQKMFGEEGLHAMWVADMDFRVPECVVSALREYVESGVYGYYKIPDAYYQAFIDWEREHHGYEVKKEWIRFSPGVVAGFHWLLQILTEENDAVIVNTPVYYPFLDAVKNNHRNLIPAPSLIYSPSLINSFIILTVYLEGSISLSTKQGLFLPLMFHS